MSIFTGLGPIANADPIAITAAEARVRIARDPYEFVDYVLKEHREFAPDMLTTAEQVDLADYVAGRARADAWVLGDQARVMKLLGTEGTARLIHQINTFANFDDGGPVLLAQLNFAADATEILAQRTCDAALGGSGVSARPEPE